MFNFLKRKSRAQLIQQRLEKSAPSELAVAITGKVSSKKHNRLISSAVREYNNDHERKVFNE